MGLKSLSEDIAPLDDIALPSNPTVRNLGVIFNQDMSFTSYINQTLRNAFFQLHNIAKVWHILSQANEEKLVRAFVNSRLDYCNSLLSGCPLTTKLPSCGISSQYGFGRQILS